MAPADQPVLGVLGGGQLSLMLVEAAKKLGLDPHVFLGSKDDPAFSATTNRVLGSLASADDIATFLSELDTLVFENEFLSEGFLRAAAGANRVNFVPDVDAIYACSDKLHQKRTLSRLQIPSPRYVECPPKSDETLWLKSLRDEFPSGYVLKWARLGYDGYGVMVTKPSQFTDENLRRAKEFMTRAFARDVAIFAEALIPFERELAMVAVRSTNGEMVFYPLVITEQLDGRCAEVLGPASSLLPRNSAEAEIRDYVRYIGEALRLYGSFAVEFFQDASGQVYVNEVAPRVHNSGHYTQDAAASSQFENHWRGILGWSLGSTKTKAFFGMLNVLGPDHYTGPSLVPTITAEGCRLHWYHKQQSTPGRKLGHINFSARTFDELKLIRDAARKDIGLWQAKHRTS